MKKRVLFFFFLPLAAQAQHEADKWYFGSGAAIDFTPGAPTVIASSAMNPTEGCAVISDGASGNLLFYTDGASVWNNTHALMPNGTGLYGGSSSTQAAIIVPQPGNDSIYFIFTTDETGNANGLCYSTVNMNLQGGLGDVVVKNSPLVSPVAEKLAAVKDPLSGDFWIAAHGWGNNTFYLYRLGASGLSAAVTSNAGIVHRNNLVQNTYGQMKFDGCGMKLACAIGYQDTIEVFSFNATTGAVTNAIPIPSPDHVYGIEFSPDGTKLYAGSYMNSSTSSLFQYDITLGSTAAIMGSQVPLSTAPDIYPLQLGPDGKIYVGKSFAQYLGVIDSPNTAGTGCNFVGQGFDLDPSFTGINAALSLPAIVSSFVAESSNCAGLGTANEEKENPFQLMQDFSSGDFVLTGPEAPETITVFDSKGSRMDEINRPASSSVRFGASYPPGIYFVRIASSRGLFTMKLIKCRG